MPLSLENYFSPFPSVSKIEMKEEKNKIRKNENNSNRRIER